MYSPFIVLFFNASFKFSLSTSENFDIISNQISEISLAKLNLNPEYKLRSSAFLAAKQTFLLPIIQLCSWVL
jgi:hypothetical protein